MAPKRHTPEDSAASEGAPVPANAAADEPAAPAYAALPRVLAARARVAVQPLLTTRGLILGGILVLAFAIRLSWVASVREMPDKAMADPLFYDSAARMLAAGKGYLHLNGVPTAEWPPGYPLLLAAIYKVFGHSIALAKLVNILAGAGTCLLVYLIAKRTFNVAVGLVAAFILALFPSQIFFSTLLMTEVLSAFLVALLLFIVITFTLNTISWRRVLLVGLLLGAMSLIRGETVFLFAPIAVVWAVAHRSVRRGLSYGLLACAATGLV
ncbi:MAG: glycosyltransferase family 39 protein, partial [Dehalococcoidia bacterium]